MEEKRPTVGAIVSELSQKTPDTRSPIELQQEMQKKYMDNLLEAVDRGYKKYPGDFYVHVETKAEKVLANTFRNYFIDRATCPTPNYDQSVFKYSSTDSKIEYLWTIPDKSTCEMFIADALLVAPEEKQLLKFVVEFYDGTLFRLCKKFNKEKLDTPEIIKD